VLAGDKIIMARNCHKSVYNGVKIRRCEYDFLYPGELGDILPEDVSNAFSETSNAKENHKKPKAVIITSPTYEGVVSDIESIAKIVHEKGAVLIVDEAHGAHFSRHSAFPKSAISCGADIVIQSLHKTLPAMTQTALLHICSNRVDVAKVKNALQIFESSSPSYVMMGSVDACVNFLKKDSKKAFDKYVRLLDEFYIKAKKLKNITIKTFDGAFDFDRSKIVIHINRPGMGKWLYDVMLNEYHMQLEMASYNYALAMTSVADGEECFNRLFQALLEIDNRVEDIKSHDKQTADLVAEHMGSWKNAEYIKGQRKYFSFEVEDKDTENVDIYKSCGRVSGENVYLYPPGIPLVIPGEIITKNIIELISKYKVAGLNVIGTEDEAVEHIKVCMEETCQKFFL
jgi:arginine/lysine/ornithine decarboxylase